MSIEELNNILNELIRLAEDGKNPIPLELLNNQIELIKELKDNSSKINLVMSHKFKNGLIDNDISKPVINDQYDLITILNMRLDCYNKLKELYIE